MALVHGSGCEDPELLHQLVNQELLDRGITVVLATPRTSKKGLAAFATPAREIPHLQKCVQGKVFGRRLAELTKTPVNVGTDDETSLMVAKFVVSACKYIEDNVEIEGIYRMSGSHPRQKAVRVEIEDKLKDLDDLVPAPHVLDVASLLKQFLRELPEPVIPRLFHPLLTNCHASSQPVENLQLALLLLPPDHIACLSFLLHHLDKVAASQDSNRMCLSNLAIVLSPNLLPSQEVPKGGGKDKKGHQVDVNSVKLKLHTDILEMMLRNSDKMGFLTPQIYQRYKASQSAPSSYSEGEMLDDGQQGAARRKTNKKKHVRRRSGSLSRVLSVMGKAMGLGKTTPSKREVTSVHSTPLPVFGGTPAFPSPRANNTGNCFNKRSADDEHDQSPNKKVLRRTFESTFTPKMRKRSFSVKRFKRKKSDSKMKPMKETLVIHTLDASITAQKKVEASPSPPVTRLALNTPRKSDTKTKPMNEPLVISNKDAPNAVPKKGEDSPSPPVTRLSLTTTPRGNMEEIDSVKTEFNHVLDEDYAEVKAQYVELKQEVERLEAETLPNVDERFNAVLAQGTLPREPKETSRQLARVRRSSEERKPRSPSLRRIGVIKRRSREREEKLARASPSLEASAAGPATQTAATRPSRSPTVKRSMTPGLTIGTGVVYRPSIKTARLQRGQPNSTSVGLEKPLASPVLGEELKEGGRGRIKMSFKGRDKPTTVKREGPIKATLSPLGGGPVRMRSGDSLNSLKNDISDLIEKSFKSNDKTEDIDSSLGCGILDGDMFEGSEDKEASPEAFKDETDMVNRFDNISFKNSSPRIVPTICRTTSSKSSLEDPLFNQCSPVTRSQLRRQSHSFQFARPADVVSPDSDGPLRRQSSAFEFHTNVEPTYENLTRDVGGRASMRRRNSSVKDLILRLEATKKTDMAEILRGRSNIRKEEPKYSRPANYPVAASVKSGTFTENNVTSNRVKPMIDQEPLNIIESVDAASEETWVDGAAFFNNIKELNAPQCGRSSLLKIRQEIRGRVQDSVTKFSSSNQTAVTPASTRPTPKPASCRRLSARLGVGGTPASIRLGHGPSPMSTPIGLPSGRRSTLTGIRTTTASRNLNNYANSTVSSTARTKDQTPLREKSRSKKSPVSVSVSKARKSPIPLSIPMKSPPSIPVYQNVRVERKKSNSRDIRKKSASQSSSKERNKARVRRNKSTVETSQRVVTKPEERRYLTIGYPGDVRSPLKETQNLISNQGKLNGDQTPGRTPGRKVASKAVVRSVDEQENLEALSVFVARTHSLRSDALMSPFKVETISPLTRVKRAQSDRGSPRRSPYIRPDASSHRYVMEVSGTPRRSPRLVK